MTLQNRAWFSHTNLVKTATVTTDSETSSLPVTNVQNRLAYKIWRTEASTASLQLDFGSSVAWQAIVLMFTAHRDPDSSADDEIDATDQITINASDVAIGNTELLTDTVDSNVNRVRGYFGYLASSEITSQYLEIEIAASSRSSLGYFDLGYAHVGPVFQPAYNYNRGAALGFSEESLVNVSPTSGSTFSESRGRLLSFSGVWPEISVSERATWETMQENCGVTVPIAFGTTNDSDLSRKVFIGRFNDPIEFQAGQNRRVAARASLIENR